MALAPVVCLVRMAPLRTLVVALCIAAIGFGGGVAGFLYADEYLGSDEETAAVIRYAPGARPLANDRAWRPPSREARAACSASRVGLPALA